MDVMGRTTLLLLAIRGVLGRGKGGGGTGGGGNSWRGGEFNPGFSYFLIILDFSYSCY